MVGSVRRRSISQSAGCGRCRRSRTGGSRSCGVAERSDQEWSWKFRCIQSRRSGSPRRSTMGSALAGAVTRRVASAISRIGRPSYSVGLPWRRISRATASQASPMVGSSMSVWGTRRRYSSGRTGLLHEFADLLCTAARCGDLAGPGFSGGSIGQIKHGQAARDARAWVGFERTVPSAATSTGSTLSSTTHASEYCRLRRPWPRPLTAFQIDDCLLQSFLIGGRSLARRGNEIR